MHSGMVFDIQRFSIHDGPGVRTTVFLKGCSLRCFWCHNPESTKQEKQLIFFSEKCINCNHCMTVCKQNAHIIENGKHRLDRTLCTECGECAQSCEAKALVMSGSIMNTEQIMEEIRKDTAFYQTSNGGVTFSGGEPLLQIDFLEELLRTCKQQNLHTAVETAGNVKSESFDRIIPYTDLFLYDLKTMDSVLHKKVTGVDNQRCLSNLEQVIRQGNQVRVRVPVIPGINDSVTAIEEITSFVTSLDSNIEIELMPFHKMGQSKYNGLDLPYKASELEAPSQETLHELRKICFHEPFIL